MHQFGGQSKIFTIYQVLFQESLNIKNGNIEGGPAQNEITKYGIWKKIIQIMKVCLVYAQRLKVYVINLLKPISPGILFGVSEPNFVHSHLYIYRQLKSKRRRLQLQNSRDDGCSKFSHKLDEIINKSKIKGVVSAADFFRGSPKINRGTQNALVYF